MVSKAGHSAGQFSQEARSAEHCAGPGKGRRSERKLIPVGAEGKCGSSVLASS